MDLDIVPAPTADDDILADLSLLPPAAKGNSAHWKLLQGNSRRRFEQGVCVLRRTRAPE
jgi:hypothetical protein